jgi:hypothetical protein
MVAVVTMHVWRIEARRVPSALGAIALDRRRVRALSGVRFAKLLGTSQGFSIRDADPTRWALLVSWASREAAGGFDASAVARRWQARARETWQAVLRPLASRGTWSGRAPFGVTSAAWDGPVAALTRARLAPRQIVTFWRAVPPVAADVSHRPGLCAAFGVGEAPLGVQGTFSLWRDAAALREYAYQGAAHRDAIRQTAARRWYAEELFARFAVLSASGSLGGRDPLAVAA